MEVASFGSSPKGGGGGALGILCAGGHAVSGHPRVSPRLRSLTDRLSLSLAFAPSLTLSHTRTLTLTRASVRFYAALIGMFEMNNLAVLVPSPWPIFIGKVQELPDEEGDPVRSLFLFFVFGESGSAARGVAG